MAYCIPSTCSAKNFEDGFNYMLRSEMPNISIVASVSESHCYIKNTTNFEMEDLLMMIFLISLGIVILLCTIYDVKIQKGNKKGLFKAFSLYTNGKDLLNTNPAADTLMALNGIRIICTCIMIYGHRKVIDISPPLTNTAVVWKDFKKYRGSIESNAMLIGDAFFFMSGLLVSYPFLNRRKNKPSGFNVLKHYYTRYIRLTPSFIVMILLHATLFRYMFEGPLFRPAANHIASNCRMNWWTYFTYVNNYVGVQDKCMGHGWHLAVDMQLYLLSPLILYPMWKWPRRWNILITSLLIIIGIIAPFTVAFMTDFLSENPYSISVYTDANYVYAKKFFFPVYARFGSWMVGMTLGYILAETKNEELKFSKLQATLIWFMGFLFIFGSFRGPYTFYQPDEKESLMRREFQNGLARTTWGFGLGIIVFMCTAGYGGLLNKFLSWKIFYVLNRLCFAIYLLHRTIQIYTTLSVKTPAYFNKVHVWAYTFFDGILSIVLGAALSLCIELPMVNIEKYLSQKGRKILNESEEYGNKLHKKKE